MEGIELSKGQLQQFHERLIIGNVERVKICCYIIIALEVFMLGRNIYNYGISFHYYVQLYLAMLVACVLQLTVLHFLNKVKNTEQQLMFKSQSMFVFYLFVLFWGVIITLIDQST